jgi:hypothetical protein
VGHPAEGFLQDAVVEILRCAQDDNPVAGVVGLFLVAAFRLV